ncbi:MAG: hypothetical protein FWG38_02630, partial [Defluviitaleaceae bacterium]|nr:hypothetical protein [Defluviitaleaceae bacterium]
ATALRTCLIKDALPSTTTVGIIGFDDFPGDLLGRDYCEWSEAGANCNEWDLGAMIEAVQSLVASPVGFIIVDQPFGAAHDLLKAWVDFFVWIDTPPDVALARRILRDFTRRDTQRRPLAGDLVENISAHLDFYLSRHRDTYLTHIATVKPTVDLVVDGEKSPAAIAREIINGVQAAGCPQGCLQHPTL